MAILCVFHVFGCAFICVSFEFILSSCVFTLSSRCYRAHGELKMVSNQHTLKTKGLNPRLHQFAGYFSIPKFQLNNLVIGVIAVWKCRPGGHIETLDPNLCKHGVPKALVGNAGYRTSLRNCERNIKPGCTCRRKFIAMWIWEMLV